MAVSWAKLSGVGVCRVVLVMVVVAVVVFLAMHQHLQGITRVVQQKIGKHIAVHAEDNFRPEPELPNDHPDMKYLRKYARTSGLPTEKELANMTRTQLVYVYHGYMDNVDYLCHRKLRMGKVDDGGWEVCDDYEFRPIRPCVAYSFGINYDFSFDDDVARVYGCHVFSFDPTMKNSPHMRSEKVRFLKVGLGGAGGKLAADIDTKKILLMGGVMKSFTDIRTMLGHNTTAIDILKIDIEYSEWSALPDILDKGELTNVRQLFMEFHTKNTDSADTYRQRLLLLARIEALGFRRFHTHLNPWGFKLKGEYPVIRTTAYEVYFVNTAFKRQ